MAEIPGGGVPSPRNGVILPAEYQFKPGHVRLGPPPSVGKQLSTLMREYLALTVSELQAIIDNKMSIAKEVIAARWAVHMTAGQDDAMRRGLDRLEGSVRQIHVLQNGGAAPADDLGLAELAKNYLDVMGTVAGGVVPAALAQGAAPDAGMVIPTDGARVPLGMGRDAGAPVAGDGPLPVPPSDGPPRPAGGQVTMGPEDLPEAPL